MFLGKCKSINPYFRLQALLLSPTYELALQTGKVVEEMAKYYPNFKVRQKLNETCHGGTYVWV